MNPQSNDSNGGYSNQPFSPPPPIHPTRRSVTAQNAEQAIFRDGNAQSCTPIPSQGNMQNVTMEQNPGEMRNMMMRNYVMPYSYVQMVPSAYIMQAPVSQRQGQVQYVHSSIPQQQFAQLSPISQQGTPYMLQGVPFIQMSVPQHQMQHSRSVPSMMSSYAQSGQPVLASYPISRPMPIGHRQMGQPAVIVPSTAQQVQYVNTGMSISPQTSSFIINQDPRATMRVETSRVQYPGMRQSPVLRTNSNQSTPRSSLPKSTSIGTPAPKQYALPPGIDDGREYAMSPQIATRARMGMGNAVGKTPQSQPFTRRANDLPMTMGRPCPRQPAIGEKRSIQPAQISHSAVKVARPETVDKSPLVEPTLKAVQSAPQMDWFHDAQLATRDSVIFEENVNEQLPEERPKENEVLGRNPFHAVKSLINKDLQDELLGAKELMEKEGESEDAKQIEGHFKNMDSICDLIEANAKTYLEAARQATLCTRFSDWEADSSETNELITGYIESSLNLQKVLHRTRRNVLALTSSWRAAKQAEITKEMSKDRNSTEKENDKTGVQLTSTPDDLPAKKEIKEEVTMQDVVKQEVDNEETKLSIRKETKNDEIMKDIVKQEAPNKESEPKTPTSEKKIKKRDVNEISEEKSKEKAEIEEGSPTATASPAPRRSTRTRKVTK
ncbi:unnamed protein product, partial [Mesorhabditis belari]|uniref:Uncharacterized protein n=1 Tax=Mesorhabditis belari TaxID=2138241 RepID=A0AAF3FBP0_9BILA